MTVSSLGEFQAKRANVMHDVAVELIEHRFLVEQLPSDPDLHCQIVLPGAKRAITTAVLDDARSKGFTSEQIVRQLNEDFERVNATRLREFEAWKRGALAEQLQTAARRRALRQARTARLEAEIEAELNGDIAT